MTALIPKVSQLSSRVIRILGCNPGHMTLQGTNTYIIGTGSRRVLLDTGEEGNAEYVKLLKDTLNEKSIKLDHVVITHWHSDHIGGVSAVQELISDKDCSFRKFRLKNDENFVAVSNEDEVKVEGATIKFYHTPGHTEDHLIGVLKEENAVFSGDCILGEGTTVFENLKTYLESLNVILDLKPSIIYPGHGPVIDSPIDKIKEYISHRLKRESDLLLAIPSDKEKAISPEMLVDKVYQIPEILKPAAVMNVNHHLSKLVQEDKIESTEVDGEQKYYKSSK
ncbi:Endoribonuclease LACTB2 [Halotydeus destructor]|nr:Endoribonuclease LACTB2 [Halotydeus destructor]